MISSGSRGMLTPSSPTLALPGAMATITMSRLGSTQGLSPLSTSPCSVRPGTMPFCFGGSPTSVRVRPSSVGRIVARPVNGSCKASQMPPVALAAQSFAYPQASPQATVFAPMFGTMSAAVTRPLDPSRIRRASPIRRAAQEAGLTPSLPSAPPSKEPNELCLMTLNLQYFSSYPADEVAAEERLREATGGVNPPDVICVQEGLACKDVLRPIGFKKIECSGQDGVAQTVYDMVYGDEATLKACPETSHQELLVNQIYMREDSQWEVIDSGTERISSDLTLLGGGGRAQGVLAIRSMVWIKLRFPGSSGSCVYVMCTHISGGRFEDQYFVQQLAQERYSQPDRIIGDFFKRRTEGSDDLGILIGDFNATKEWNPSGPMHGYFKMAIMNSAGVEEDREAAGINVDDLEDWFKTYMISPFTAITEKHGWQFAYTQEEVGVTSGFGHLIDHMATSRSVPVKSTEMVYLTNQKFSSVKDTEIPLTDHNSVKATFLIA